MNMIEHHTDYWFYLEPYVYVDFKQDQTLLYNTFNSNKIIASDPDICELLKDLYQPKNGGVMFLSRQELAVGKIRNFVLHLREYFMGDLLKVSASDKKPIQFIPILNLHTDPIKREEDASDYMGEGIFSYWRKLTVYLNSSGQEFGITDTYSHQITFPMSHYSRELPAEKLFPLLTHGVQRGIKRIEIIGENLFEYSQFNKLVHFITGTNIQFILGSGYLNITSAHLSDIRPTNIPLHIYIHFPIEVEKLHALLKELQEHPLNYKVIFAVTSEQECEQALLLTQRYKITTQEVHPVYTGSNMSFFEDQVFLNETDITAKKITMKEIFSRQKLNTHFFGNLIVTPDGKLYANLNEAPLGTVDDFLPKLFYKEIKGKKSWLSIRDKEPCASCVYQFLCPSPSNYERVMQRSNLCHVR